LPFNLFWVLVRLQNSVGDFWGLHLLDRGIFWVSLEAQGFFLVFPIPHSHLPGLSLEIQSTPPPPRRIYTQPLDAETACKCYIVNHKNSLNLLELWFIIYGYTSCKWRRTFKFFSVKRDIGQTIILLSMLWPQRLMMLLMMAVNGNCNGDQLILTAFFCRTLKIEWFQKIYPPM